MRRIKHLFILLAIACCATSCNEYVELCYTDHPHRAIIDFQYNWGKDIVNIPDSMKVLAYRRINNLRYTMSTTAKEKNNTGRIISPIEEIDSAGMDGNSKLWLRNGKYEMFAFNEGSDELISQLPSDYNLSYTMPDEIIMAYKSYKYIDQNERLARYMSWVDANTYSEFVLNGESPIYYAQTYLEVPVAEVNPTQVVCKFDSIKIRNQFVNVNFQINPKDEGIIIDSIHAEMSGICSAITLGSGVCNTEKTYKTLFTPDYIQSTEKQAPLYVHSTFSCTGIVRAMNSSTLVGPGIMQLNVHVRLVEDGRTIHKMYRACINLYNTLTKTPSIVYSYDKEGFVQAAQSITLNIEDVLSITREGILESDDTNIDRWKDVGTIYLEI